MAAELKKFQAELLKIDTAISNVFGERKALGDSEGNTKKLLDGARLAVGDRAQELKAKGSKATTLAEFAADPEIAQALETAKTALANFKGTETRKIKNYEDFKSIYTQLKDLSRRMDAEVADRKKKLFEPKSLPDMVKLATKVKDTIDETGGVKTQSIKDVVESMAPKAGAMENNFKAALELEVKKSAAIRANAAEAEVLAKFTPRLMKLRTDKAVNLGKEAEAAATAALTAKKANNLAGAKAQVATAITKATEMNTIVTDYGSAYSKNKSFLAGNPEHDEIFKMVSGLTSMSNRVLKAVKDAQTTVG